MQSFDEFLLWEKASNDTLDFKKAYVDMAGDLVSGLLLSQIVYWHLPKKNGDSRLRVFKDGFWWIAKEQAEWWDEIRLSAKQVERAMSILEGLGLIVKKNYLFNNRRTNHVRINHEKFMESWQKAVEGGGPVSTKGGDRNPPKGATGHSESGRSITETTSETTIKDSLPLLALTALEIYQSVTKIRNVAKIPQATMDWIQEQEDYLAGVYYPEALRAGIIDADKQGRVFDTEFLDSAFIEHIPDVETVHWTQLKNGRIVLDGVEMSNGDKVAPIPPAAGWDWIRQVAMEMIEEDSASIKESRPF